MHMHKKIIVFLILIYKILNLLILTTLKKCFIKEQHVNEISFCYVQIFFV